MFLRGNGVVEFFFVDTSRPSVRVVRFPLSELLGAKKLLVMQTLSFWHRLMYLPPPPRPLVSAAAHCSVVVSSAFPFQLTWPLFHI